MTPLLPEEVKKILPYLRWDYDPVKDDMKAPRDFYYVLINVYEGEVFLDVHHLRGTRTEYVGIISVPTKLLKRAVKEQGGSLRRPGYYLATKEIRDWVCAYASKA